MTTLRSGEITEILSMLRAVWLEHPEYRFGQLIEKRSRDLCSNIYQMFLF